ncbi:hypothetical protein [Porcincola intestinalis]|uniref:YqzN/YkzM domain-containing protein n=1 Tax=Porcincola intestinalis TaxID=2606632 RepID=A0A6L5X2D4_9FIRM|nr:hypothetical protein [Porcincola intestinalis]MSS13637.1 hypothetical protein [Porcincola intestinalis]
MAGKNTAKVAPAAQTAKPEAAKFSIAQLRTHCVRLFNITSSTFDGAMYGHTEPMTVEEAQRVIKEWLGKEAK